MDAVKNVNVLNENTASLWQAGPQPPALNRFSKRSFHVVVVAPTPHDDGHDFIHSSRETDCFVSMFFRYEDHNRH